MKKLFVLFSMLSILIVLTGCGLVLPNLINEARKGNVNGIKALLDKGADVNEWYYGTPLWYASAEGQTDAVKLLIDRGANLNTMNKAGDSALAWAALNGYADIVKILIDAGADVDAALNGVLIKIASYDTPYNSVKLPNFPLPGVEIVNMMDKMGESIMSNMTREGIAKWKKAIYLINEVQKRSGERFLLQPAGGLGR